MLMPAAPVPTVGATPTLPALGAVRYRTTPLANNAPPTMKPIVEAVASE
jgi:hypothetical protein